MIKIIVAIDKNGLIGNSNSKNGMPWYNKEDLEHFKKTTMNNTIVMGRKTIDLIKQPLIDRQVIVLSSNAYEGSYQVCNNYLELVDRYKDSEDILYVCGGASVYKLFMPYCDELLVSVIPGKYYGDVYFPTIDKKLFMCNNNIKFKTFSLQIFKRRL